MFVGYDGHVPPSSELHTTLAKTEDRSIDVISLGAVTEIANLLSSPRMAQKIASITMMGGTIALQGNVTARVEANFSHDVQALRDVAAACKAHAIPLTIVPLDLTHDARLELTSARFDWLMERLHAHGSHALADLFTTLVGPKAQYTTLYQSERGVIDLLAMYPAERRFAGPVIHDATAVLVKTNPELFYVLDSVPIQIFDDGAVGIATAWMTEYDGVANIALRLRDPEAYWQKMLSYLSAYD